MASETVPVRMAGMVTEILIARIDEGLLDLDEVEQRLGEVEQRRHNLVTIRSHSAMNAATTIAVASSCRGVGYPGQAVKGRVRLRDWRSKTTVSVCYRAVFVCLKRGEVSKDEIFYSIVRGLGASGHHQLWRQRQGCLCAGA